MELAHTHFAHIETQRKINDNKMYGLYGYFLAKEINLTIFRFLCSHLKHGPQNVTFSLFLKKPSMWKVFISYIIDGCLGANLMRQWVGYFYFWNKNTTALVKPFQGGWIICCELLCN